MACYVHADCTKSGDYLRVQELAETLAKLEDKLEQKESRWLELAERAEIS